jgi:molybdopterin biosynthesis enzyme
MPDKTTVKTGRQRVSIRQSPRAGNVITISGSMISRSETLLPAGPGFAGSRLKPKRRGFH